MTSILMASTSKITLLQLPSFLDISSIKRRIYLKVLKEAK